MRSFIFELDPVRGSLLPKMHRLGSILTSFLAGSAVESQRKLSRKIEANISGYTKNHRPIYTRQLSECRNIQKQRQMLARIHEKIADIRNDFLHKESTKLVSENQVIAVEELNIRGMLHNHKLAKAISDVSWGRFLSMLE